MEIGFNNDVVYRGVTFHIQTEDHGSNDRRVSTQLFVGGRIIENKTVDYSSLIQGLEGEELKEKLRKIMVSAHKALYKKLIAGHYDEQVADLFPQSDSTSIPAIPTPDEKFNPSQDRVPASAAQVLEDDEGRVTFTFDDGEAIDLKSLGEQLGALDILPQGDSVLDMALFGDLGELENLGQATAQAQSAPPAAFVVPKAHPDAIVKPQLVKVRYKSTGKRAFQGLIEPPPDLEVFELVSDFLQGGV